MKTCSECNKEFEGRGSTCGSCRTKKSRGKLRLADEAITAAPEVEVIIPTLAKLLPVNVSAKFSEQQLEALALHPKAVHNTRNGRDEWVVPGACKWGECLNPSCGFHTVVAHGI